MTRPYGTRPDLPDHRDHPWKPRGLDALPHRVDLRRRFPPVFNQGLLNSCSANALSAAVWFEALKDGAAWTVAPSRLFIYYNERSIERQPRCNVPVSLRDGFKALSKHGVCRERHWRYVIGRFSVRPPKRCFAEAEAMRVDEYARVRRNLKHMKACLAGGSPFTMGVSVYESFESPHVRHTGLVPIPATTERLLGGHALLVVGYNDSSHTFIVRNSWGPKWGRGGYCFVPYDFVVHHRRFAWDFWTIVSLASAGR
jgi:C1A family cysteine protease